MIIASTLETLAWINLAVSGLILLLIVAARWRP